MKFVVLLVCLCAAVVIAGPVMEPPKTYEETGTSKNKPMKICAINWPLIYLVDCSTFNQDLGFCFGHWQCMCSGTAPLCNGHCENGWTVVTKDRTCGDESGYCITGQKFGCKICVAD